VLGRKTYEIFAGYWPNASDEDASIRDPLNNMPKHVASRTLREPLEWNNSKLIPGDVAEGIRALKAQEGNPLLVIGSGNLVQSLMTNELVDEYRVMIYPLLLGSGSRLFREGTGRQALSLADVTTTNKGVIVATYRPAEK
jgi:dihydrofolate reductase